MPAVILRRWAWTLVFRSARACDPVAVSSSPVSHSRSTSGFVTVASSAGSPLRNGASAAAMEDWTADERKVFADLLARFVTALDR
jgi:hypothetical protein